MAETLTRDNLIAGDFPIVTETVTVKSGAGAVARGTVLGKITTGGKCVPVDSAVDPADGSEKPYAVIAEDVDATSADKKAVVYLTGEFLGTELKFGGTDTVDTHKAALRDLGIYAK